MAARLGKPFMPWQQHVADVILEVDPLTGRLAYSEFGLTVPRQSGKSTLVLAKAVHRASAGKFFGPRQKIVYTAQTRHKAREKWEEDYAAEIEASQVFRSRVSVHKGNGNEHMRFMNGSRFGIEANTEKAGHGGTIDEAYIDEAFAQVDGRLEQAFRPAMITRANKQLGVVSTAGWENGSPYLWVKVMKGRDAVTSGSRSGMAYFEWSAPNDADPFDRGLWPSFMPALGFTITEDAVADELATMDLADFMRAYMNRWVPKPTGDGSVIDAPVWLALADPRSVPDGRVALAVDVSPDRAWSSIAVAGLRADGLEHVEVAEHRPGVEWVLPRLVEMVKRNRPLAVVVDRVSPAASLLPDLRAAGIEPVVTSSTEMGQACGGLFDSVITGRLRHLEYQDLNDAVAAARKRDLGAEGAWGWARKGQSDITTLVAVTLARYGYSVHGPSQGSVYDRRGMVAL